MKESYLGILQRADQWECCQHRGWLGDLQGDRRGHLLLSFNIFHYCNYFSAFFKEKNTFWSKSWGSHQMLNFGSLRVLMKSDPWYIDTQVPSTLELILHASIALVKAVAIFIILLLVRRFLDYWFPINPECNWNVSKKILYLSVLKHLYNVTILKVLVWIIGYLNVIGM